MISSGAHVRHISQPEFQALFSQVAWYQKPSFSEFLARVTEAKQAGLAVDAGHFQLLAGRHQKRSEWKRADDLEHGERMAIGDRSAPTPAPEGPGEAPRGALYATTPSRAFLCAGKPTSHEPKERYTRQIILAGDIRLNPACKFPHSFTSFGRWTR
jgi:hypothetical protein